MGKGDKKTKKGKISSGSYGVLRKRKKTTAYVGKPKAKKAVPKKVEVAEEPVKKTKPVSKKAPAKKGPTAKK